MNIPYTRPARILAVLAALLLAATACGAAAVGGNSALSGTTAAPATTTGAPARLAIVSLSPTATEILFAIGATRRELPRLS